MSTVAPARMTAEAYLAWERDQPQRHEFHRGEVFAMAGGSPRHNGLCAAIIRDLGVAFRGGRCRMLTSDQRVSLRARERYVYADAIAVCGAADLEQGTRDVITNPSVIVEVLSRSTEAYDRGDKWSGYRALATLDDYLLASQREPLIEHYQRQPDGSWRFRAVAHGERVELRNGVVLAVDDVYEGVFDLPGDEDS